MSFFKRGIGEVPSAILAACQTHLAHLSMDRNATFSTIPRNANQLCTQSKIFVLLQA